MEPISDTRVSVVIPTWNRRDLAAACLRSLREQTHRELEIIVVDDASSDGTAEMIRSEFPEARVLRLARNSGFAVAVNTGIRVASGTWIFLLNNDVTLAPDCLERMLRAADETGAAMVAPLILWKDSPEIVYAAGDRVRVNGRPESIGFRQPRNTFSMPDGIFGVSAAAGLYHRELFDAVGLLDERFEAYFEDSDLCFRARLAGLTAALAPDAVAFHIGSASITGKTWWRSAQCFRNHALLVLKDMPGPLLLRFAPRIAWERAHQARRLFSSARTEFGAMGALKVFVRTLLSLLGTLPYALRERGRIQRSRKISLIELRRLLSR